MNSCLRGLTGRVVVPECPAYNEARQDYNRAVQQYPLIINYCEDRQDVINAVCWAQKRGVPLRIRGGGHNYAGYSNGNCTLIVDVSGMHDIRLDEAANTLTVGGGVTNRQVYAFMAAQGYPFPGGTCPTVGVGGYATGGGWGLSCRYLGLGCDSLLEIELINAQGRVVRAGREQNADLFWACRGAGGGNFGVIVSMVFALPQRAARVTLIEIDYLHASSARQRAFLDTWQQWLVGADSRATLIARVYNEERDGLAMLVRGFFYGEEAEAQQLMAPFLALPGAVSYIESMPFIEAVTIIGGAYPDSETFYAASRFATRYLSEAETAALAGTIRRRAPGSAYAGLSLYALGGQVEQTGQNETAFYYRHARYILWLETIWEEAASARENRRWVDSRFPLLASMTEGAYVNFPYNRQPDYLTAYYGGHVDGLRAVKRRYDPGNVFSFPQGIGSAGVWRPAAAWSEPAVPVQSASGPRSAEADSVRYRRFGYAGERKNRV